MARAISFGSVDERMEMPMTLSSIVIINDIPVKGEHTLAATKAQQTSKLQDHIYLPAVFKATTMR